MYISFEWDPEKAISNARKHGISFETAARVFADPFALSGVERIEAAEQRWQTIGVVEGHLVVVVAHTVQESATDEPDTPGGELIRIISARQADRSERQRYERENR